MFGRRLIVRPPFLRRPRILGAALAGGIGFAAGRASKPAAGQPLGTAQSAELTARLKELADMHATGQLTDAEFAAAKSKLLG